MISREDLLHKIKDAMWVEEHAFPIHQRHLEQSMRWYGFSPDEEREVRDTLKRMAKDTRQHAQILQEIHDDVAARETPSY